MRDKKQEKTYVEDVSRSVYDIRNEEKDVYRVDEGLTEAIVSQISKEKNDPAWMQNFRLESLKIYNELSVPDWGRTSTELRKVLTPPSLEMDLVLTKEVVSGALWTTFVPVSRFWPLPAKVMPVNSARAPLPFKILMGYR